MVGWDWIGLGWVLGSECDGIDSDQVSYLVDIHGVVRYPHFGLRSSLSLPLFHPPFPPSSMPSLTPQSTPYLAMLTRMLVGILSFLLSDFVSNDEEEIDDDGVGAEVTIGVVWTSCCLGADFAGVLGDLGVSNDEDCCDPFLFFGGIESRIDGIVQ